MSEDQKKKISIVMPAYQEEGNLDRAYEELTAAFSTIPQYDYEILVIDNASTDRTGEIARGICEKDTHWKYLRFSRNFGAETSITMGMRLASGDALMTIFSDLQDPPERIPDFVAKWEEGYDVVYGVIKERQGENPLRTFAAHIAYRLIRYCSDVQIPADTGDFRIISRRVKEALDQFDEQERYVRGLVHWVGYPHASIEYERRPRQWGKSKAPFWWCFQFALNAITSFSTKPLKLFTVFGLVVLAFSLALSAIYIVGHFLTSPPPGVSTMLVLLSWNLAIMSLGIGILGEYIGHIYIESKNRPKCFVDGMVNFDADYVENAIHDRRA